MCTLRFSQYQAENQTLTSFVALEHIMELFSPFHAAVSTRKVTELPTPPKNKRKNID